MKNDHFRKLLVRLKILVFFLIFMVLYRKWGVSTFRKWLHCRWWGKGICCSAWLQQSTRCKNQMLVLIITPFRPGPHHIIYIIECIMSWCYTFDLVTGLLLLQAVRMGSVCSNSGEFQFLLHADMYYATYIVTPPRLLWHTYPNLGNYSDYENLICSRNVEWFRRAWLCIHGQLS